MRSARSCSASSTCRRPRCQPYDEALLARDLALFPEWCVQREFGVSPGPDAQRRTWGHVCRLLVDSALAQPTVAVHRDCMPRNLMVAEPNPGILDFQDAVRGPDQLRHGLAAARCVPFVGRRARARLGGALLGAGAPRRRCRCADDFGEFWRQLEWMGLQRHLKVLGIFCRLKHRDGKPAYAADLPRFFAYATKVALRYRPLQPLLPLMEPLSGAKVASGFTF